MGPPAELHDKDFEERLRESMRRRATDVQPRRPEWDTLAAVRHVAVSTSSGQGAGRGRHGREPFPGWVRPVLAAASVLAIVLVGAVVLDRSGEGDPDDAQNTQAAGRTSPSPAPGVSEVAAPGSGRFDLQLASPVHPVTDEARLAGFPDGELAKLADAYQVANDYLATVGIEEGRGPVGQLEVDTATDGDRAVPDVSSGNGAGEVSMAWSTWGVASSALTSGHVFLRRTDLLALDGKTPDAVWIVVGARTEGVLLEEVHREGTTMSFVVNRDRDGTGVERVRVEVNDRVLQEGKVALDGPEEFIVQVPVDDVAVIRLQHFSGEDPISVTTMAVPAAALR